MNWLGNLVLASDFPSTRNQIVAEWMRSKCDSPRIAWIPPCSIEGRKHFTAAREKFGSIGFINLEYVDIHEACDENPLDYLRKYDVVYLTGGNPIQFRYTIDKSELDFCLKHVIKEGALVIGASGGAMQFTTNVSLFRMATETIDQVIANRESYEALSIVDYEFLPHLNRFDSSFLDRVRQYSEKVDNEIVAAADGGAVLHTNGNTIKYIGKVISFYRGAMTDIGTET